MATATRIFGLTDALTAFIKRFKTKDEITQRDVQHAVRDALATQDILRQLTPFGERVESARNQLNGTTWTSANGKDAFLCHVYGDVPCYQWFLLAIDENPTADEWKSIANQIWPDDRNMPMQIWADDGSPQCGALEVEGRTRINGYMQLRVRGARQVVTELRIGSKVLPLFGAGWTELWLNSSWEPSMPFLRFDHLYEHGLPYETFAIEVEHLQKKLRTLQYGPSADN